MDETCAFGGLLRRSCGAPALSACVYCGRPFCQSHGARGEDYTDVCLGKKCRAKLSDLDAHRAWKRAAAVANLTSLCAREVCEERMRHQCSRCLLLFCAAHVEERYIMDIRVQPAKRVAAVVCRHCAGRRKVWE